MNNVYDQAYFERLIKAGKRNKLSRRDFMSLSMTAGVTIATASSLWTESVSAQTPRRGGTVKVGVHQGNISDGYDPAKYASFQDVLMAHTFRSYLTEITPDNKLGPNMADSWSASADAKTWTFELSKVATFHSGKAFTAKDAVASLNYHRGESTASAAAPLLEGITEIKPDGDHVLIIQLSEGLADLPWLLTDYHFVMLPAKSDGTIEWENADGAGPYKIENYEPGVRASLSRHDGWHREGAYFDGVEFNILNDPNARQTALITGDIDLVTLLDHKTISLLERNQDIKIDNVPSGSAITLPMFCDHAPFDNVDVRLALKHAINREEIIDKIVFGKGTVGNDFHVSPNMPYYPQIEQRTYDPDKAKFHLKQAGMDSIDVSLSATESILPGAVDLCVLYAEQAKAAGININVEREPSDGYWSDVWLKKPFVFVKWGARPTPDNIFTLTYKKGAAWNEAHWENERFNELLSQAKAELDENLRAQMYQEMCEISRDDGGTILPMFVNHVYARRKNVMHGTDLTSSWEVDGAQFASRWWFSDDA